MNRFLILIAAMMAAMTTAAAVADDDVTLAMLDTVISHRDDYIAAKQRQIDFLQQRLRVERDTGRRLEVLEDLYNEYHVFRLDSATAIARRGLSLARETSHGRFTALFSIHMAEILAIGGMYAEAITCLDEAAPLIAAEGLQMQASFTYFNIFTYWAEYCHDDTYAPRYRAQAVECLRRAMTMAEPSDPFYDFYMGENHVYVEPDSRLARKHYRQALKELDETSRVYAMAANALAGNYRMEGDSVRYEQYLIRAALSDLKSCTMENAALQNLALHLFHAGDGNIERALRYINLSMDDARFYNNRLRILEISDVLPEITTAYQEQVHRQNRELRRYSVFISLLLLSVLVLAWYVHRQSRKIAVRGRELASSNERLSQLNDELAAGNREHAALNEQLNEMNSRLLDTNRKREGLAAVYIDLCARFIEKLSKYQTLVKRKIKANQAGELLSMMTTSRLSDEDADTFLRRFDKAFLDLYPTFIDEFNALLEPEHRQLPRANGTLTTELRTFALIRLGVKSTADISGLLFLSPQTIYNCRSLVKSHALDRDTFDDAVAALCQTV